MRYAFSGFELRLDSFELVGPDGPVHVEPQVFDVLAYLVEHRDRVVTKNELLDHVWESRFVSESTLTSRIKHVRMAIGDSGRAQHSVHTVHGKGYQFTAAVQPSDAGSLLGPPSTSLFDDCHRSRTVSSDGRVSWPNPLSASRAIGWSPCWVRVALRRYIEAIPKRRLSTVLFTDLVESTARAAAAGDTAWRELLDRHDELSRQTFRRHGGSEVKHTGDGFLVTFDGPAQAIRCGHELCQSMAELAIQVRVGVHAGEVEVPGDDLGGISVHICARVMGQAGPGQVLVSSSVPPLVAGSGLDFESVGSRALKGVPDEWELFRSLP